VTVALAASAEVGVLAMEMATATALVAEEAGGTAPAVAMAGLDDLVEPNAGQG
jgi:hypothetical protein